MTFLLFLLLSLLSGYYLWRLLYGARPGRDPAHWFEIILASFLTPSFIGLILLECGRLTPSLILLTLAVSGLFFAFGCLFRDEKTVAASSLLRPKDLIWLTLILVIAACFRLPASNYIIGGQDPGVYVNTANHFALRGQVDLKDPLAELFAGDASKIKNLYYKDTYRAVSCKKAEDGKRDEGDCRGSFIPGFYLGSLSPSRITPQFYHLHPLWMSYMRMFLGGEYTTSILPVFSLLGIVILFMTGRLVTSDRWSPLIAAGILALSPAHAYFARFPVSEVTGAFFFLAGLYFLLRTERHCLASCIFAALFMGGFFFTRITSILVLGLLFCYLLAQLVRTCEPRERRHLILFWAGLSAMFLWSYYHGLFYSASYSGEIWSGKLGVPGSVLRWSRQHMLLFSLLFTGLPLALLVVAGTAQNYTEKLVPCLRKYLPALGWLVITVVFAIVIYRGYELGFTDHLVNRRWIGKRWHLANRGWFSVLHLNFVVLMIFISPVVFALMFGGWLHWLRESLSSRRCMLLAVLFIGLLIPLTVRHMTAPYLYYFGRYLACELLPLAVLAGAIGLERLKSFKLRALLLTAAAICLIPFNAAQARHTELDGLYSSLNRLADSVGSNSVVFIDSTMFPVIEIATPLRVSFDVLTFVYSRTEYTGDALYELMHQVQQAGYHVFLLSQKNRGGMFSFLQPRSSFRFPLSLLLPEEEQVVPVRLRSNNAQAFLHEFVPASESR